AAGSDDLAVGLEGQREGDVGTVEAGDRKRTVARIGADERGAEVGERRARGTEGPIRGTVGIVADEREVEAAAGGRDAARYEATVGLDDHGVGLVVPAEVGDDPASAPERRVERSVGVVA